MGNDITEIRVGDPRVLLYGDVNLNIIDGSAVWLVSMAEALDAAGVPTTVLLKAAVWTDRLSGRLEKLENIRVVEPFERAQDATDYLTPRFAARRIAAEFESLDPDVLIVRGINIAGRVASNPRMAGRTWAYVTELPGLGPGGSLHRLDEITEIASRVNRMLAQTESARSFLESIAPAISGRVSVLPPMVPDAVADPTDEPEVRSGHVEPKLLRLIYAGKMARAWNTLEIVELPKQLRELGVEASLTIVGDKVHEELNCPGWHDSMNEVLSDASKGETQDVTWLGGISREETLVEMAAHEVGLSWRDPELDSSLEVSTKVLEYAANGVAPVINKTDAHVEMFGAEYPFLVTNHKSVLDTLVNAARHPNLVESARRTAAEVAREYSISAAATRLRADLDRYTPDRVGSVRRNTRVLIATHDMKFMADVMEALDAGPYNVRVDTWSSLREHDEDQSHALLDWADVVFCEWAGPNAVWYSKHKRDSQRLIVRLHRFEINGPWIDDIDIERVDDVVFVSEYFRDVALAALDWPTTVARVVPNSVDCRDLLRPKIAGAEFNVGILGVVPTRKRLDLAVDLIQQLVDLDERFTLHIRGRAPWDYEWEWKKPALRDSYLENFDRLLAPGLRGNIVFEEFGPDVGNWLRGIGWVLSPSSDESFHLAPLEGMASKAVPLFWPRDGAAQIFGERWVHSSTEEIASYVGRAVVEGSWRSIGRDAAKCAERFDTATVRSVWLDLFSSKR